MSDDDAMLSFSDAYAIGEKIVEMADRVRVGSKIVPGAQAKWGFEMDGDRFEVIVSLPTPTPKGEQHGLPSAG
jgi:hypothetical protein